MTAQVTRQVESSIVFVQATNFGLVLPVSYLLTHHNTPLLPLASSSSWFLTFTFSHVATAAIATGATHIPTMTIFC